jgi:hypothetical protein
MSPHSDQPGGFDRYRPDERWPVASSNRGTKVTAFSPTAVVPRVGPEVDEKLRRVLPEFQA